MSPCLCCYRLTVSLIVDLSHGNPYPLCFLSNLFIVEIFCPLSFIFVFLSSTLFFVVVILKVTYIGLYCVKMFHTFLCNTRKLNNTAAGVVLGIYKVVMRIELTASHWQGLVRVSCLPCISKSVILTHSNLNYY